MAPICMSVSTLFTDERKKGGNLKNQSAHFQQWSLNIPGSTDKAGWCAKLIEPKLLGLLLAHYH